MVCLGKCEYFGVVLTTFFLADIDVDVDYRYGFDEEFLRVSPDVCGANVVEWWRACDLGFWIFKCIPMFDTAHSVASVCTI